MHSGFPCRSPTNTTPHNTIQPPFFLPSSPLVLSLAPLPRRLGIAHALIHGPPSIELFSLGRVFAPRRSPLLPSVHALSMHPQNFSASSSQGCSHPPSTPFPIAFTSALNANTWPSDPSFDTAKYRLLLLRACSRASSNDAPAAPPRYTRSIENADSDAVHPTNRYSLPLSAGSRGSCCAWYDAVGSVAARGFTR